MLFQRFKEKQEAIGMEDPRLAEEETIRRWRDKAAARNNGGDSSKIVVGRFEDDLVHSNASDNTHSALQTEAPQWPELESAEDDDLESQRSTGGWTNGNAALQPTARSFQLEESAVVEEAPTEEFLSSSEYSLGDLRLDEQEEEIQLPTPRRATPKQVLASDANLSLEDDLQRRFGSNIRSALGAGTVIEGTFRFDSPVCVEGTLSGEVYSSSALIVGAGAKVTGKITVGSLIVLGEVEGSVEAAELVEIRSGARLDADMITRRIAIEDGGRYNGRCTLHDD